MSTKNDEFCICIETEEKENILSTIVKFIEDRKNGNNFPSFHLLCNEAGVQLRLIDTKESFVMLSEIIKILDCFECKYLNSLDIEEIKKIKELKTEYDNEEVVVEEQVIEESVVEELVVEEQVTEEPIVEEQVAEEPVVEEPVAEEQVAEEQVAEETVVEEPVVINNKKEKRKEKVDFIAEEIKKCKIFSRSILKKRFPEITSNEIEAVLRIFVNAGRINKCSRGMYEVINASFVNNEVEDKTENAEIINEQQDVMNSEEIVVEEQVVEEPVVEEQVVEEQVVEEQVVEESADEEPVVEEPVVEEPAVEEPVVEEPADEEQVVEEPFSEESVVEKTDVDDSSKVATYNNVIMYLLERAERNELSFTIAEVVARFSESKHYITRCKISQLVDKGLLISLKNGNYVIADVNGIKNIIEERRFHLEKKNFVNELIEKNEYINITYIQEKFPTLSLGDIRNLLSFYIEKGKIVREKVGVYRVIGSNESVKDAAQEVEQQAKKKSPVKNDRNALEIVKVDNFIQLILKAGDYISLPSLYKEFPSFKHTMIKSCVQKYVESGCIQQESAELYKIIKRDSIDTEPDNYLLTRKDKISKVKATVDELIITHKEVKKEDFDENIEEFFSLTKDFTLHEIYSIYGNFPKERINEKIKEALEDGKIRQIRRDMFENIRRSEYKTKK